VAFVSERAVMRRRAPRWDRKIAAIREARAGIVVASGVAVIPLVAVSGADCVDALRLAGFGVRSRSSAVIVLERDARVVMVADVAMLPPEDLLALLRDAGITYDDFLDLLSETPTDPDVHSASMRPRPSGAV
jgi:hypothetical protein